MQMVENWPRVLKRSAVVIVSLLLTLINAAVAGDWWGLAQHMDPATFHKWSAIIGGPVVIVLRIIRQETLHQPADGEGGGA